MNQGKSKLSVQSPKNFHHLLTNFGLIDSLTDHFAKLAKLYVDRWVLADICQGINKQQFGNRQGVSTIHYLVDLLHFLHSNADKPQTVSTMVITDFTKAFDFVNQNIAVSKLHLMGVLVQHSSHGSAAFYTKGYR